MLTRREKLLVRPWQLRRYNNHRKKVLTALPAIDFGPPPERGHVTCKLKKLQSEGERKTKIEEDNFKLLQRMGDIMKKNRLDNHWVQEPPNFLHRVGIYHRTRTPSPYHEISDDIAPELPGTRRSRCVACTPSKPKPTELPEERIPWAPPKRRTSRRRSSSITTVPFSSDFDFSKLYESSYRSFQSSKRASSKRERGKSTSSVESQEHHQSKLTDYSTRSTRRSKSLSSNSTRRLTVKQGDLELSVNFPPYAEIKLSEGDVIRVIQREHCECKKQTSVF